MYIWDYSTGQKECVFIGKASPYVLPNIRDAPKFRINLLQFVPGGEKGRLLIGFDRNISSTEEILTPQAKTKELYIMDIAQKEVTSPSALNHFIRDDTSDLVFASAKSRKVWAALSIPRSRKTPFADVEPSRGGNGTIRILSETYEVLCQIEEGLEDTLKAGTPKLFFSGDNDSSIILSTSGNRAIRQWSLDYYSESVSEYN